MSEQTETTTLPESISHTGINLSAFIIVLIVLAVLEQLNALTSEQYLLTIIMVVAVPIILLERFFLGRRMREAHNREPGERFQRSSVKVIGLVGSFAGLYLCYWLFPFLQNDNGSQLVPAFFNLIWIPLVIISPLYIWYVDDRMEKPNDSLFNAGLFFIGKWHSIDRIKLKQHALAWIVKTFFFWFITSALVGSITWWLDLDIFEAVKKDPFDSIGIFISFVFMIDLVFSTTGYFCAFKLFKSENRSVDPTLGGWLACMICYGPMYGMLINSFTPYENNYYWGHWLDPYPFIQAMWAIPIVVFLSIYMFATIQFGIRFSNLTHRGIITNGPFRYTKHPQYIAKNIAYWLIYIPFVPSTSVSDAIKTTIFMALFSFVFYLRAKTEERHLRQDPVYIAYENWITEHGIIAKLKRILPHSFTDKIEKHEIAKQS